MKQVVYMLDGASYGCIAASTMVDEVSAMVDEASDMVDGTCYGVLYIYIYRG